MERNNTNISPCIKQGRGTQPYIPCLLCHQVEKGDVCMWWWLAVSMNRGSDMPGDLRLPYPRLTFKARPWPSYLWTQTVQRQAQLWVWAQGQVCPWSWASLDWPTSSAVCFTVPEWSLNGWHLDPNILWSKMGFLSFSIGYLLAALLNLFIEKNTITMGSSIWERIVEKGWAAKAQNLATGGHKAKKLKGVGE